MIGGISSLRTMGCGGSPHDPRRNVGYGVPREPPAAPGRAAKAPGVLCKRRGIPCFAGGLSRIIGPPH